MAPRKRFSVSIDDVEEGTLGICLSCGNVQGGAEPDAQNYECEECGAPQVYGMEEAVLMGSVDLDGEDR